MRKSFILHIDSLQILDSLTDEQAGQLFKKIYEFHNEEKPKETQKTQSVNSVIDLVFVPFKLQFDRDLDRYNNVCERNKNNGKMGGRPKLENPEKPKKPDSKNKSDSDSKNDNKDIVKNVFNFKKSMLENSFKENLVDEWLKVRKSKKLTNSETALNGFLREVELTGIEKNEILRLCIERSWGGFKASWMHKELAQTQKKSTIQHNMEVLKQVHEYYDNQEKNKK